MGDVLSQSEIDNLLAALSSGEIDADEFKDSKEKQVKNYNFARPSKFSKEHLRALEVIFENYGRLLATNLPAYLRKTVQVEVINSEAQAFQEFTNALSNPVLLGVIEFAPLDGNILIELAENVGYAVIDRMLGGTGIPLDKPRDFSEIELSIIERIFVIMTNLLVGPFENVVALEPRLVRIETNSQFAQIISPTEMASIVTMNVKIGNVEGMMNVCLPYECLEKVIDKLNTKFWYSTLKTSSDEEYRELIEVTLAKARVPVKAVLGRSVISVNDIVNMQKGDIIKLDTKITDELKVYVGNIDKFRGLPGESSNVYAIKVTNIVREEES